MIDGDDVEVAILALGVLGIAAIGVMSVLACGDNEGECSKRACVGDAKAMIVNDECACVGKPLGP